LIDKVTALPLSADMITWLAGKLTAGKSIDLSRTAIVFNGKRPALYLNRAIAGIMGTSFFPPRYFSIDELMGYIAEQHESRPKLTEIEAAYRIYIICQQNAPALLHGREKFSQFLPWAKEILRFIDLCDKENTPEDMLKNAGRNAEIGLDVPDGINTILKHLHAVRTAFHALLEDKQLTTGAYRYLQATKLIEKTPLENYDTIIFAGFHYLHTTEKAVVKTLLKSGKGRMVFFGSQDEWPLLKQNANAFGIAIQPEKQAASPALTLYSGTDTHTQAAIARQLIGNIADKTRTLILLPDGAALVPLLSEISQVAPSLNVSLGYPIRKSALYSLINAIVEAQGTRNDHGYHAKAYLKVLSHQIIKTLAFDGNATDIRALTHTIENLLTDKDNSPIGGSAFVTLSAISAHCEPDNELSQKAILALHTMLFTNFEKVNTFAELCEAMNNVLTTCFTSSTMERYPLNIAAMNQMRAVLDELAAAPFASHPMPAADMFRIFMDSIETTMEPFSGTPLQGLQVLGMLESRLISFDNVIVLDANEDKLPTIPLNQPLIPREVMRMLGFEGLASEEEIQRHRFMRLVRGAKTAHIIYNESDESEKSRFVQELIWDHEQTHGTAPQVRSLAITTGALAGASPIIKSRAAVHALHNMTWSASRLDTYLNCPKKFYFRYIQKLDEQETVDDETDARDVGTFLHELLEQAYQPLLGKTPLIDEEFITNTLAQLRQDFAAKLAHRMKGEAPLVLRTMLHRIEKFLRADQENLSSTTEIISLEMQRTEPLVLKHMAYPFTAKIDRVERLQDGSILVLDYKSGAIDKTPMACAKIAEALLQASRTAIKEAVRSFQLPLYAHLVQTRNPGASMIDARLYSLQNGKQAGLFKPKYDNGRHEEKLEMCMEALAILVHEINNPATTFEPDESTPAQCASCAYRIMCR
jgi:ATP-dependent helicase/nuclease subunit B